MRRADHATPLYQQILALTSPTSGSRSVGIVRSLTYAIELSVTYYYYYYYYFILVEEASMPPP
jgi:hypothetical protein